LSILNRVLCTTAFSVENGDDTVGVVDHPLFANLEANTTVAFSDEPNQFSSLHDGVVLLLPLRTPTSLKVLIRNGADEVDRHPGITEVKDDFRCSNIHSTNHPRNEYDQAVCNDLLDFLLQDSANLCLKSSQLLWAVSCEATPMHPLFVFCHILSLLLGN